jgi:hypothetical protein
MPSCATPSLQQKREEKITAALDEVDRLFLGPVIESSPDRLLNTNISNLVRAAQALRSTVEQLMRTTDLNNPAHYETAQLSVADYRKELANVCRRTEGANFVHKRNNNKDDDPGGIPTAAL